jgi:hypothetical protein
MPQQRAGNAIKVQGGSFHLIKALVGYREDIERQFERFPFERNVFLMMRFRKGNKPLSDFIIDNLSKAGLNGVRADQPDWNITKDVYNPIAVLYCCKYGIALFDKPETDQAYNPNVIYELGIMHSLGRECLILRNDSLPAIPFDLIKNLYMPYRGKLAVQTNIQRWLAGIVPGSLKPPVSERLAQKSKLEYAAVSAKEDNQNTIVSSPRNISASVFSWKILSKDKKSWEVSWSINLANEGRKAAKAKVQVLFLAEDKFALDDHVGPVQVLPPNKNYLYSATTTMSPDLANRIHHAMATVLTTR